MGHIPNSGISSTPINLVICKLQIVVMFFSHVKGLVYPVICTLNATVSRQFLISILPPGLWVVARIRYICKLMTCRCNERATITSVLPTYSFILLIWTFLLLLDSVCFPLRSFSVYFSAPCMMFKYHCLPKKCRITISQFYVFMQCVHLCYCPQKHLN